MAGQEDQLTPVQERLLDHVLDRALEPEPGGVPVTEFDAVLQDDAARLVHELTYREGLLAFEGDLYFPTLRAMRRRGDAFADAIAPLQGVLDYGRQLLNDRRQREKIVNVDDVVKSVLPRFPQLSATPVRRRFNWALFGLHPFVQVQNWSRGSREPKVLQFLPDLYRAKSLEDVFREQQIERDEGEILDAFLEAHGRTRRRQAFAMMLREDPRRELALRSLIDKGDAEMLDTVRVVATEQGLANARSPLWVKGAAELHSSMLPEAENQLPDTPVAPGGGSRLKQLLDELEQSYGLAEALRTILRRDADEVEGARRAQLPKSVLLLSGSVLEGVLVDALDKRRDLAQPLFEKGKKGKAKFPDDASLRDLLELVTSAELAPQCGPLLPPQLMKLAESVVDHRDLIHPHREVREAGSITIDEHTAEALYNVLCLVLRDLAKSAKAGWIAKYEEA